MHDPVLRSASAAASASGRFVRRGRARWARWSLVVLSGLVGVPGALLPGTGREAVAQTKQKPLPDDPFAEELNPFPKGEAEKPRTGQTPRTTKPKTTPKGEEATSPPESAPPRGPKRPTEAAAEDTGADSAAAEPPRSRPKAKPMIPGADLLPFPDAGLVPDLDEDSPVRGLLERAEKLDRKGRHAEAKVLVLEALEEEPKLPLGWLALGIVNRHLGDFHGSVEACSTGLRLDPEDAELYLRRGIAWFHLGRHGIALEDFEDAAGIAFEDPRPELWRGLTLMELDRPLEAISAYSSAIRRDRTFDLAYLNRGLAYLVTDEPGKAEADFDHAIRHDPRDARAWFNRGVAQARQQDYDDAVASYEESLRIDPSFAPARRNLDATRGRVSRPVASRPALRSTPAAELVPPGRVTASGRPSGR